jgi:hypothetical protein
VTRFARVALLTFALTVLVVGTARSCSCMPPGSPRQELEESDAVFAGIATHVSPGYDRVGDTLRPKPRRIRFSVLAAWKGVNGKQVTVTTASSGPACGYDFVPGDTYLVYANGRFGMFGTSICTRTTELARAGEDLAALGPPALDRRENRSTWDAYGTPTFCPLHASSLLRTELTLPLLRVPSRAFEAAKARFPFAGLRPAKRRDPIPEEGSLVCGWCRRIGLEWSYAQGVPCPEDEVSESDPRSGKRTAGAPLSEADYRLRYPFENFAIFADDGGAWSFDSIEGRLTLRRRDARDTTVALPYRRAEMRELYETMIAYRVFDLPIPNPGAPRTALRTDAGACDEASLFVRSDTLVRMYSWRLRSAPAVPVAAGDEWRRLDDALRAVMARLVARPEVRALLAVPRR